MPTVLLLKPRRFGDARGWFSETYSRRAAAALGIDHDFVQDNQSFSAAAGTFRGLHFQTPPRAQAKLVRCPRGRIMDYAVDVRRGSPTWGRWLAAELSAENGYQLYVPVGFAHAFLTLEPDSEVAYKVSDDYAPDHDGGIRFDSAGIPFPMDPASFVLSDKDTRLPTLAEFDSPFPYDGVPLAESLD